MLRIFASIILILIFSSCNPKENKVLNEFSNLEVDSSKISQEIFNYSNEFSIYPPQNWRRVLSKYENKKISLNQSGKAYSYLIMKTFDLFNENGTKNIMSVSIIESDSTNQNILKNYIDLTKLKFRNDALKIENFSKKGRDVYVVEIRKQNIMSLRFLILSSSFNIFQIEFTFNPDEYDSVIESVKSSVASLKFL